MSLWDYWPVLAFGLGFGGLLIWLATRSQIGKSLVEYEIEEAVEKARVQRKLEEFLDRENERNRKDDAS